MPGNGYDLMPGYQVAMVIRRTIVSDPIKCLLVTHTQFLSKYMYLIRMTEVRK